MNVANITSALPVLMQFSDSADDLMPIDPLDNLALSLMLAGVAFIMTLLLGRPFIDQLKRRGIGKQIRIDGPEGHESKIGTPTMGGLLIVFVMVAITVTFNLWGRLSMLLPLGVLCACCVVGSIDDRNSLVGSKGGGLSEGLKMLPLLLISVVAGLILHFPLGLSNIYIPFAGQYDIGIIYLPIAIGVIAAFANAVNFADGLDTLAGGTAAVAFVAYGIIAFLQGQVQVVTFCFTAVGALLGFLWYNAHPAQVFMGDSGSLPLGAALATAAFMTGQWLLLGVVGLVFVAEAVSVVLQRYWFKYTRKRYGVGRRIFRIAPLHHHFEAIGWSETQVTMRFWLWAMMSGLLGVALALV